MGDIKDKYNESVLKEGIVPVIASTQSRDRGYASLFAQEMKMKRESRRREKMYEGISCDSMCELSRYGRVAIAESSQAADKSKLAVGLERKRLSSMLKGNITIDEGFDPFKVLEEQINDVLVGTEVPKEFIPKEFRGLGNPVENKKEEDNMEFGRLGVYDVYIVHKGKVVKKKEDVVAENKEDAKFKAGVYSFLEEEGLNPSDVFTEIEFKFSFPKEEE